MGQLINLLCQALNLQKCVNLDYGGYNRTVEVHIVGRDKNGNYLMRCFQVSGGSSSGANTGWKLMDLTKVNNAVEVETASLAPRQDFNPQDPVINQNSTSCSI